MNKTIIISTTPFLFATETCVGGKRMLELHGCHAGLRRRGLKQGLVTIIMDEDDVKTIKDELWLIKILNKTLGVKESRALRLPRHELTYGLTRFELSVMQKPGQPTISLHSLVKKENLKIDQQWFLDGFIDRFSALLESFLQKEDLSKHALKETVTGGLIQLHGDDFNPANYRECNRILHVVMEAADGISYLIFNDQGNVNFAIRNPDELKEVETLVKEIERAGFGLNFAGVLNSEPRTMMTAYQSLNMDWKVFDEPSRHFIVVQTSAMMLRRIKFNPTEEICDIFKTTLKGIKETFVNRYITTPDGMIHIEVETGSTPIRGL